MRKLNIKEIRNVIQRVLNATLWGHLPHESQDTIQDIIDELELEDQQEMYNELLRQKAVLRKQHNKIDTVLDTLRYTIFKDEIDNDDENNRTSCLVKNDMICKFTFQLMKYIDQELFDPESGNNFSISVIYDIASGTPANYGAINNITKDINDLWLAKKDEQSIDYSDKNTINAIIQNFELKFDEEPDIFHENKPLTTSLISNDYVIIDMCKLIDWYISMYICSIEMFTHKFDSKFDKSIFLILSRIRKCLKNHVNHGVVYDEDKKLDLVFDLYIKEDIIKDEIYLEKYLQEKLPLLNVTDVKIITLDSLKERINNENVTNIKVCVFVDCKKMYELFKNLKSEIVSIMEV